MPRAYPTVFTVFSLAVAAILLTGCPKASPPQPGAGLGGGAESSAGQTAGAVPSGPPSGAGAGAVAPGLALGGVPAGGTTFPVLPSPRDFVETAALRDIHFDFDQHTIRTQDAPVLDANARWLASNPGALLLIEGHTDERGTNEYNLALAERRAKATRDSLVVRGIPASRLTIISYGEERPGCTARTEGCWEQNRRAHFLVRS